MSTASVVTIDESIFRSYDMRGVYPTQVNEEVAYRAGQAFVTVMGARKIVIGRDVRSSGESLQKRAIEGALAAGADVIDVGIISTEMLYFAAGSLGCDGGFSLTASHNPPEWNGIKFIGKGAAPILKEDKLGDIYDFIRSGQTVNSEKPGTLEQHPLLDEYVTYLQRFIPKDLPKLRIVANANFGANGPIVDALMAHVPSIELIRLNWEQDGTFPKGTPDPFLPKNREEVATRIKAEHADLGLAWDADADRCFIFDAEGRLFHGYYIDALLADHFLSAEPGGSVVLERRLIWAVLDAIKAHHGTPVWSKVGHGFIKRAMREHNAIFAGESSGHFYYRDFFVCDNGLITILIMLKQFADAAKDGRTPGDILNDYMAKYPIVPEELNYTVTDAEGLTAAAAETYKDGQHDTGDGLSVEFDTWRFNLRSSQNEPVVRINLEARTQPELEKRQRELMDFMVDHGATLRNDS